MDWKMSQLQREAVTRREQLAALNGYIDRLGTMLAEAQSFEGYYRERVEAIERRLFEVGNHYLADAPILIRRASEADDAEAERLRGQLGAIERERDEQRAQHTTTGTDSFQTLTFCALRPSDVITKRSRVIMTRDQIARELAAIEGQLTPGQIVETGVPATEYEEHRQRVQALRERVGVSA